MEQPAASSGFYRTVITFEVLSEGPIPPDFGIDDIVRETIEGGYSGQFSRSEMEVTPRQMAALLEAQASDPGFFGLAADGTPA